MKIKTIYIVTLWNNGECSTAEFKTKEAALDSAYLIFGALDPANKYSNCKFFENGFKDRNCSALSIDPSSRDWSVRIEKVRGVQS